MYLPLTLALIHMVLNVLGYSSVMTWGGSGPPRAQDRYNPKPYFDFQRPSASAPYASYSGASANNASEPEIEIGTSYNPRPQPQQTPDQGAYEVFPPYAPPKNVTPGVDYTQGMVSYQQHVKPDDVDLTQYSEGDDDQQTPAPPGPYYHGDDTYAPPSDEDDSGDTLHDHTHPVFHQPGGKHHPVYYPYEEHPPFHDYHFNPHHSLTTTTTTTTTERPEGERVNRRPYSYFYLGRKLWYIPLYFSVYFIIYITVLVVRSIAKHKINYKGQFEDNRQQRNLNDLSRDINEAIERHPRNYIM